MIRPFYFANKRGRKPIGIETMLRIYLMQIGFSLSDEGIEDSIYDSHAMRSFMHIDFNEQQVPDATTLLKFRHMLEANKLGEKIFADVNNRLDRAGLMIIHQQQTCIHKVKSRDHPYKGVARDAGYKPLLLDSVSRRIRLSLRSSHYRT